MSLENVSQPPPVLEADGLREKVISEGALTSTHPHEMKGKVKSTWRLRHCRARWGGASRLLVGVHCPIIVIIEPLGAFRQKRAFPTSFEKCQDQAKLGLHFCVRLVSWSREAPAPEGGTSPPQGPHLIAFLTWPLPSPGRSPHLAPLDL